MDLTTTALRQHTEWMQSYLTSTTQAGDLDVSDDYELVGTEGSNNPEVLSLSDGSHSVESHASSSYSYWTWYDSHTSHQDMFNSYSSYYFGHHLADTSKPTNIWSSELPRKCAIDLDIAGRQDGHTFKDFRSAGKARRRNKTRRDKYFNFEGVKPGALGKPHHDYHELWSLKPHVDPLPVLLQDAPIVVMTKSKLFRQAQLHPRPPKAHRCRYRRDKRNHTHSHGKARKHTFTNGEAALMEARSVVHWLDTDDAQGACSIWGECPICWPEREWDEYGEDFVQRVLAGEDVTEDDVYRQLAAGETSEEEFEVRWNEAWKAGEDESEECETGEGETKGVEAKEREVEECEIVKSEAEETSEADVHHPNEHARLETPAPAATPTLATSSRAFGAALSRAIANADSSSPSPGVSADQVGWDFVNGVASQSDTSDDAQSDISNDAQSDTSDGDWSEVDSAI